MGAKNKPCTVASNKIHHWTSIDIANGRDKLGNILTKQITVCRECGKTP